MRVDLQPPQRVRCQKQDFQLCDFNGLVAIDIDGFGRDESIRNSFILIKTKETITIGVTGNKPAMHNVRVLGCPVSHVRVQTRTDPKSRKTGPGYLDIKLHEVGSIFS
jgi:hypothetical protein